MYSAYSLIRTIIYPDSFSQKKIQYLTLTILYDVQMSAGKRERTIKQTSILSYFSKTSN